MEIRLADDSILEANAQTWLQVDMADKYDGRYYLTLDELEAMVRKVRREAKKRDKARREAYKQASLEG